MTVTELATSFTALCAEGKFEEPGQSYWSDAIVSVEPMDSARITMDEHALNTVKDGRQGRGRSVFLRELRDGFRRTYGCSTVLLGQLSQFGSHQGAGA